MLDQTVPPDAASAAPPTPVAAPTPAPAAKPLDPKEVEKYFKGRIAVAKVTGKNLHSEWKRNVELRIGKIASSHAGAIVTTEDIQSEVNPDWSLTKTKTANLYSQVPAVQCTHENKKYAL